MHIKYIPYREDYRKQLSQMIIGLYTEDPEGEPMSQDKIDATIAEANAHPEQLHIYMMTDDAGNIVGYAIIQLLWSNEWSGLTANIDELYVVEKARNQGIAGDFINSVEKLIPGVNRLTLEVSRSNDNALRLYRRLGFGDGVNRFMERT